MNLKPGVDLCGKLLLIILVTAVFSTCSKRGDSGAVKEAIATANIPPGGVLVIGINGEPDALNPLVSLSEFGHDIISLVFSRLATLNADLNSFSPQLARSWEFSPDSLQINFHLRTGVFWHDGHPFSAGDILFTHNLQVNEQVAWDGSSYKKNIKSVSIPDDSTVIFQFNRKTPSLLMDAVEGYIVPEHILKDISADQLHAAEFNRRPVGTGPFRFLEWKSQQSVTLEKFDHYYITGKPHLQRVIFRIVASAVSLSQQIRSHDLDFIKSVPAGEFVRARSEWEAGKIDIRPVQVLGRSYDFIGWNLIDPGNYARVMESGDPETVNLENLLKPNHLFGSQKVRSALSMAIDKEALVKVVNQGLAIPMHGPIPPILQAYNPDANEIWPYDPGQALKILNQEGWRDHDGDGILDKDGIPFRFEIATNSGNERREQALTVLQDMFRKIQVQMTPRLLDPGLLYGRLLPARNFDAVLIGWDVGLKTDFTPLFHSSSIFIPFNLCSFRSADFDHWHDLALQAASASEARKYWDAIAGLLSYELPYTWLYYRLETALINARFQGAVFDKRGVLINVEDWWIPQDRRTDIDRMFSQQ